MKRINVSFCILFRVEEEERKMPESVTAHTSVIDTSAVRSRHYLVMAWNINRIGSVLKSGH